MPRPRSSVHLGPEFVATNSLTKVYGLSGLRCGWILSGPELAERIWRLNDLFVVNRAQESALTSDKTAAEWDRLQRDPSSLAADAGLARRLADNFAAREALASAHAAHISRLLERCPGPHFRRVVPAFDDDVHDLGGLARVNARLFEAAR